MMPELVSAVLDARNPLDRGTVLPPSPLVIGAGAGKVVYDRALNQFPLQYLFLQNLGAGTVDVVLNAVADGGTRHFQLTASTGVLSAIALPVGSWLINKVTLWSTAGSTMATLIVLTGNNGRTLN